jgi:hypothetical protein
VKLPFDSLLPRIYSKYISLDINNKGIINSLFILFAALMGLIIYIESQEIQSNLLKATSTISLSILIAIIFSTLERIGISVPASKSLTQTTEKLAGAIEYIDGFAKYRDARFNFGVNSVVGPSYYENNMEFIKDGEGKFIIPLLQEVEKGSVISFMNSYLENDKLYYNAILDCVKRGVDFRLLLMKPDINSHVINTRYRDFYEVEQEYKNIENFVSMIQARCNRFENLQESVEKANNEGAISGKFELRYYSKSLNFPMLMISKNGANNILPHVAYTGFYTTISPELMPYIEWRGGQFQIMEKFSELFEKKWTACKPRQNAATS